MLQCVVVYCSVSTSGSCHEQHCVAVCYRMMQCNVVCYSVSTSGKFATNGTVTLKLCCSVLQRVAVCCNVVQCGAVYCSVLHCDAIYV